jgi:hypothetical protein
MLALYAIAGLSACQTMHAEPDVPAVLTDPNERSRAELQSTVHATVGSQVTIAADALTQSSWLIIEQSPPGSIASSAAQGRNMSTPIRLQLVRSGNDCVLVDQRNGDRHALRNVSCTAE